MFKERSFSKKSTLVTKGVLIILLLMHHLFYGDAIGRFGVTTIAKDDIFITEIVQFANICLSGFAFLSAYGIAKKIKTIGNEDHIKRLKVTLLRFIKVEAAVFFIYVLAILYKYFVMNEPIKEFYTGARNQFEPIYMIIDGLGLASFFGTKYLNSTWWYMAFAIVLIFAMPIICLLYDKFRYVLIPVSIMLPLVIFNSNIYFSLLLPATVLGTAFAYEDWFEVIHQKLQSANIKQYLLRKSVALIIALSLLFVAFELGNNIGSHFMYPFGVAIVFLCYEFLEGIPVIKHILMYIGKHSTNIFLTHTFIYLYFYEEFIYSFEYSWLIFIVLLLLCLIVSAIVELLKTLLGYNKLLKVIEKKMSV